MTSRPNTVHREMGRQAVDEMVKRITDQMHDPPSESENEQRRDFLNGVQGRAQEKLIKIF